MNIEENDILTLDNQEYVVASIIIYNNYKFYYIININNNTDYKFCYEKNNKIYEEFDKNIILDLIKIIYEKH